MRTGPTANAGFTLLETMLVVAVAAVMLGIGIPNLRQFIWNSRMTSSANDMLIAISAARSESIKNRAPALMCFSADPSAATPVCDGNGRQGWVVFVDNNNNGAVNTGEVVTLRHSALPSSISLRTVPATNGGYVAYSAAGFPQTNSLGVRLTNVVLCDQRGNNKLYSDTQSAARGINISNTGRARVSRLISDITTAGGCP